MNWLRNMLNAIKNSPGIKTSEVPAESATATEPVGDKSAEGPFTQTVDELLTMMQSDNKWKRHEVLLVFMKGQYKDDRVIQALGGQIRHDTMNLSSYAADALGAIGTERAVNELCDLYESCPEKRSGIVSELEKSGFPRAENIVKSFRQEQGLDAQQAADAQARRQNVRSDPDKFIAQFSGGAKAFCLVAAEIRQHWQEDRDGSLSVSEKLYRVAIKKWPDSWYGYFGLGNNLWDQTKRPGVQLSPAQTATLMAQAIENTEKACAVADSPEPFIQLAAILVCTDRYAEARVLFERGDTLGVPEDKLLYPPVWLAKFFWNFAIGASTSQANLKQEAVRAFVCAMQLDTDYVTLYAPRDPEAEQLWWMAKYALSLRG